jgi:hypothetical protein
VTNLDLLVELAGRTLGRDAQLVGEEGEALLVLAEGGLVQGIQGRPAPGIGDGGFELALGAVPGDELVQGVGRLPAEGLGLEELPIVKSEAVLEAKAAEQVAAHEGHGLGQEGDAGRAGPAGAVPVAPQHLP